MGANVQAKWLTDTWLYPTAWLANYAPKAKARHMVDFRPGLCFTCQYGLVAYWDGAFWVVSYRENAAALLPSWWEVV